MIHRPPAVHCEFERAATIPKLGPKRFGNEIAHNYYKFPESRFDSSSVWPRFRSFLTVTKENETAILAFGYSRAITPKK